MSIVHIKSPYTGKEIVIGRIKERHGGYLPSLRKSTGGHYTVRGTTDVQSKEWAAKILALQYLTKQVERGLMTPERRAEVQADVINSLRY